MVFNMKEYSGMIKNLNINIIYSGPMWGDGIKGIAEMVKAHLSNDELPEGAAKYIFSVFVEQVTNVLMYSVEKEKYQQPNNDAQASAAQTDTVEVSKGTLVLGEKDKTYFIQTGNAIRSEDAELIKVKIDHLNSLDKTELRKYYRERLHAENDNLQSKGAGLGLIEIARRTTSPIVYTFEPLDENLTYFTMYVEIAQHLKDLGTGKEKKGE